jgi:hypothetical protein
MAQHTKTGKNTKWPQNMPNGHLLKQNGCKIFQMAIEYTTVFHSKALKIYPKNGILVLKYIYIPSGNPASD